MNETTESSDTMVQAKASLKQDFSDWNIVYSNKGRWWAFLDPNRRRKVTPPAEVTAVDADTPEKLYELLAAVES